jgi:hypothetical protein
LTVLSGALLLVGAIRLAVQLGSQNYNLSYEAICLYGAMQVADNQPLYPGPETKPFSVYVHSPLGALTGGWLLKAIPVTGMLSRVVLIRSLSLLAFLALLAVIWNGVLSPAGVSRWGATAALVLGLSKFCDYATTGRNDMLAMLAEMSALAVFLSWLRRPTRGRMVGFAVLCVISVYTRQMGIVVGGCAILWLLARRRLKDAVAIAAGIAVPAGLLFWAIDRATAGAFWQHLIAYNIRPYRPIDRDSILFQHSTWGFIASYAAYKAMTWVGLCTARRKTDGGEAVSFLTFALVLSTAMSCALFLRPGGDVNYFFEPILLASYFCAAGCEALADRAGIGWLVACQLALITALMGVRTASSYRNGFRPLDAVADRIRERYPRFVWVVGGEGDSFTVHLRGWSFHGPDTTTGAPVANYCRPHTDWIFDGLRAALKRGEISAIVLAGRDCIQPGRRISRPHPLVTLDPPWPLAETPADDVCVYTPSAGDSR